jgi:hypothetical protein
MQIRNTGFPYHIWIAFFSLLLCAGCTPSPGGADGFKIAFVPSTLGQYGILSMNSDTTGSKILATGKMAQVRFASWSPDGKSHSVGRAHKDRHRGQ